MRSIPLIATLCSVFGAFGQVSFEEVSEQSGMDHRHVAFTNLGGGVAVFDYDNDGWQDIYFTGGLESDKLYRNLGNGQFDDVSAAAGITIETSEPQTFGVVTGDIDNDGWRDILITSYWNSACILFHNQGDGTFVRLTTALGDYEDWKTAATFGDINKDGFLDLYLTGYVLNSAFIYDEQGNVIGFDHECIQNQLFINNGDLTFTEATADYGVEDEGCALAVAFSDFDNDADVDIVLANDFGQFVVPNGLFRNNFPASDFTNVNSAMNMDGGFYGMGIGIGDYDRDGDLDYYQTNIGRNLLSRNDETTFTDVTTLALVENDSINGLNTTSWGATFFDADNDGWPDLFVTNGVIPAADFIANEPHDPNKLFRNKGDGTFADLSSEAGVDQVLKGRGCAVGDFDKDGRMDLVVANVANHADSSQIELYDNITDNQHNWIAFSLEGVVSNRDAFGAHVRVVVNGVSTLMEVDGGSSHVSQSSSILHFGLGEANSVDSAVCIFPSGIVRTFEQPVINQVHNVLEDVSVGTDRQASIFSIHELGDHLEIRSSKNGNAKVDVYDLNGKLLATQDIRVVAGNQQLRPLVELSAGSYVIQIRLVNETRSVRLVKF